MPPSMPVTSVYCSRLRTPSAPPICACRKLVSESALKEVLKRVVKITDVRTHEADLTPGLLRLVLLDPHLLTDMNTTGALCTFTGTFSVIKVGVNTPMDSSMHAYIHDPPQPFEMDKSPNLGEDDASQESVSGHLHI
jgi:hypothetical protein